MKPADYKRQGLAWMRQRIVEILKPSKRGERLKVVIARLLDSKKEFPYFGYGFRKEKFSRYAATAMEELVESGAVAVTVVERPGELGKDHKGQPVSKPAFKLYRCRGLLEQLAWVSRDPEPQPPRPQKQVAQGG